MKIKTLYEGEHLLLQRLEEGWEYVHRKENPAVVVVIATRGDLLFLLEQFRHPLQKYVIEFPAGLVEKGESIENAARREFTEETGFTLGPIKSIDGPYPTSAGLSDEMIYVVRADVTDDAAQPQNLDTDEEITVMPSSFEDVAKLLTPIPGILLDVKVHMFIKQYLMRI